MMFVARVDFRSFEIVVQTAYLLVSYRLDLSDTAVDEQFRSRNVAAIVTGEKYRDLRDLIGCSEITSPSELDRGVRPIPRVNHDDPVIARGADIDRCVY